MSKTIAIIGGGAAGYFAAIRVAELHPDYKVVIIEKSNKTLAKVKVSGGGRCNVTNATFEPKQLVKNYPRGEKELLGPFHKFQPGDVFDWFSQRGIALKTEDDMRVFPESNTSQTIIDCFESEAKRLGVRIAFQQGLTALHREDSGVWSLELSDHSTMTADAVIVASGSSPAMWKVLETLGHSIVEPVPSLFTFNIKDPRIAGLQGLAGQQCEVYIQGTKHMSIGPVLVTHWGLSGPGILRLSAWAARELHQVNYDFIIRVNWDARFDREQTIEFLRAFRTEHAKQLVKSYTALRVPHRLWCGLLSEMPEVMEMKWADISNKQLDKIADAYNQCFFQVRGKSTFKDEFVTAGGVELKEVDFKTMASKLFPGLFFAGEVLNIDAITGGFNFQAAWTTAWIAAEGV